MKRSDMLQIIEDFLHYNRNSPEYSETTHFQDAHQLLTLIENAGMEPPEIRGKAIPIGYDGSGKATAWDTSGRSIRIWEPEEE